MKRPSTGQNIALSVTVLAAILLMLLMLGVHIDFSHAGTPKVQDALTMADMEPEELMEEKFVDPVLQDAGDPDNTAHEEDAPMPQGEPEVSDKPDDKLVVNGPNPKPNDESEKLVTAAKTSTAKTTPPSEKEEPDRRITGMKDKFSPKNGKTDGQDATAASGQGGQGAGAKGDISGGRKLESYVLPSGFSISKTITVNVSVMVKADGSVESGSAKCITGLKDKSLLAKVLRCSEQTRWTKKAGAAPVQAIIHWTLVPGAR